MWTEVLATYAAVVSTSSLGISYLSYKSGGAHLSGSADIYGRYDIEGPALHVYVYNRGRGPITIDSIGLWGVGKSPAVKGLVPLVGWPLHQSSCALPSRIEGHSGERWHFPAHHVTKEWLNRSDLAHLEVEIGLATGKRLKLKVDASNVDVLDGHNLPDWQPDYFKGWPKLPDQRSPGREANEPSTGPADETTEPTNDGDRDL